MNLRRLCQNLALSAASFLVVALLLEVGLRMVGYDLNESPRKRYHPQLGWVLDPEHPRLDTINSHGFRFHEVPVNKPPGVKRLLILGDSFSQDTGLPFPTTFTSALEDSLNRSRDPKETWQVISLAVGGWGTAQQWIALQDIGLAYDPDIVLLQIFPYNDLCNNNLAQRNTCGADDFHRPYFVLDRQGALKRTSVSPIRTALRARSKLFGLIENRLIFMIGSHRTLGRDRNQRARWFREQARRQGLTLRGEHYTVVAESHQPEAVLEGWRVSEKLIQAIAQTLDERDIPLLGLVIPFELTLEEEFDGLAKTLKNPPPLDRDYGNRRFEDILRQLDIPLVSMQEEILASEMTARDFFSPNGVRSDRHLNRFGHSVVTRAILNELNRQRWITPRPLPSLQLSHGDIHSPSPTPWARLGWFTTANPDEPKHFGIGTATTFAFLAHAGQVYELTFELRPQPEVEQIELFINDRSAAPVHRVNHPRLWKQTLRFEALPGRNTLRFAYNGEAIAPASTRAARFKRLIVEAQ